MDIPDLPELPTLPPGYKFEITQKALNEDVLRLTVEINRSQRTWWGGTKKVTVARGNSQIILSPRYTPAMMLHDFETLIRQVKVRFDSITAHERYVAELDEAIKTKYGSSNTN